MIGQKEEVQLSSPGRCDQLRHGALIGVGMVGVAVQIAAIPAGFTARHHARLALRRSGDSRQVIRSLDLDLHRVVQRCAGQDAMRVDLHRPLAGRQRPRQIARRGDMGANGDSVTRAATVPGAAKAVWVEQAERQHVVQPLGSSRRTGKVNVQSRSASRHGERVWDVAFGVAHSQRTFPAHPQWKIVIHVIHLVHPF